MMLVTGEDCQEHQRNDVSKVNNPLPYEVGMLYPITCFIIMTDYCCWLHSSNTTNYLPWYIMVEYGSRAV